MFDPVRICTVLNEEGVDYVVIGGFAAVVHGSSLPTRDIDVVPSRRSDNLDGSVPTSRTRDHGWTTSPVSDHGTD